MKAKTTAVLGVEPAKVIRDILMKELGMDAKHVVLSYNKNLIPVDNDAYLDLHYLSGKAIGSNNYFDSVALTEVQEVAMQHIIQIDWLSFDPEARVRKEEIPMALGSMYAQVQSEANLMQIARIPSEFANASSLEETKQLNRFTLTIVVKALHRKVRPTNYYDTFKEPEVHVNV